MLDKTPAYCSWCGKALIKEETTKGYDPYSGKPIPDVRLYCPDNHQYWYLDYAIMDNGKRWFREHITQSSSPAPPPPPPDKG